MNKMLEAMKYNNNFAYTENGAVTHRSTLNPILDMFGMGAAYRSRSEGDCILLFKRAFDASPKYALKCLFYIRDVRGGQGERRFFRTCMKWLATYDPIAVARNLEYIPEFGRWDDLYCLVGTPLEKEAFGLLRKQLMLDITCKTPSLCAKWMKSENTSSQESRELAAKTRIALNMDHKSYRKMLSGLRARINVLERLMSAGKWDEIEFDKIPSKAGMKYKNAFARRDIIKAKYEAFARDTTKKVNADVLNPVDIANQIFSRRGAGEVDRLMWQKYWDNLKDYYGGREENGIAIVDVSGSMSGQPMNAAVSMGAYIAERGKGPFKDHFITFSGNPHLIAFEGVDIFDKFWRARGADWGMDTNIEAVFDMLLRTALNNNCSQEEIPQTLYIFSDMEFNRCITSGPAQSNRYGWSGNGNCLDGAQVNTLLENIAKKWQRHGYELPRVIFWNLDARNDNIPALGGRFSYVSGFSMNMVEQILSGKDGIDLMLAKLDSERYNVIE